MGVYQENEKKILAPHKIYSELLERLHKEDVFTAASGTHPFIRTGVPGPGGNLLFVGLGNLGSARASIETFTEKLRVSGGAVWSRLVAEKSKVAVVDVGSFFGGKA